MPSLSSAVLTIALGLGLLLAPAGPAPARPASAEARATPVTVVAVGDIACTPGRAPTADMCRQAATARLVSRIDPDTVITLGDLQYEDGTLNAFRHSYDASWGAFKSKTLALPGNHEYNTAGAQGFYTYFGLTAPGYRAVDVGTWRVYLLNSNCDFVDCGAERAWLRQDLAANPTACSAIALHYPRFSSGEHGDNPAMARFWRIAVAQGVDLALAGHDHDYERFAPMDAAGNATSTGMLSFVSGTGGKSLYARTRHATGSRYFRDDKFGVLVLSLGDGTFSWRFRGLGGVVRDAGSHACH